MQASEDQLAASVSEHKIGQGAIPMYPLAHPYNE